MQRTNAEVLRCPIDVLNQAPNIQALIDEYAAESAIAGLPHPSHKVETYRQLEEAGWLTAFGAYAGTDLVGFILVLASPLPHYSLSIATIESFFVSKGHRRSGAGILLRQAAEAHARSINSPGLLISAPAGGVLAAALSITKGYVETNRVFFKRLV